MNNGVTHTHDCGIKPHKVKYRKNYKFYNNNIFFKIFSSTITFLTVVLVYPIKKILWGYQVRGKENLKGIKRGITICNHATVQDGFTIVPSLYPRKVYTTVLEENMGYPVVSQFFRSVGAVPIPNDRKLFVQFLKETRNISNKNIFIQIFPEGSLIPYCDHIREFMPGAFHIAYDCKNPIIPMVTTFHKRKGIYRLKRKPSIRLNVLTPYYIDYNLPKKEAINKAKEDLFNIINEYFITNSVNAFKNN